VVQVERSVCVCLCIKTITSQRYDTIRYDTRCYFNVRSKADISQLNLPQSQLDDLELFVLSDYSRHLLGDPPLPPKKELQSPLTDAKLCALNLFFGRDNELKIYHGNFLIMDNKHRSTTGMLLCQDCLQWKETDNVQLVEIHDSLLYATLPIEA